MKPTIEKLNEQIAQLQARKKALENRRKQQARKERMRLLIQYGELVEKYLGDVGVGALEKILQSSTFGNSSI